MIEVLKKIPLDGIKRLQEILQAYKLFVHGSRAPFYQGRDAEGNIRISAT